MLWKSPNPAFTALLQALAAQDAAVHMVGGVVRDLLLGRSGTFAIAGMTDLDLVAEHHDTLALARRVADQLGWAYYPLDEARDVARLVFQPGAGQTLICDIARVRGESLEADLRLRDFTVNAMALSGPPSALRLVDPTQGQADLDHRLIRRVSPLSLADDPVRLLRAVRFATDLDFTIEPATAAQIGRLAGYLTQVSAERVRDELWKTLASTRPVPGLRLLDSLGLLPLVLPEVAALQDITQSAPHTLDVYEHTLSTVAHISRIHAWIAGRENDIDPHLAVCLSPWRYQLRRHLDAPLASGHTRGDWLHWHALLHDIGKPATRADEADLSDKPGAGRVRFFGHEDVGAELAASRLEHLRFSRLEIDTAVAVLRGHMRPHHLHTAFADAAISSRAAFRFFRDVGRKHNGDQTGLDVLLLALADIQATYGAPPDHWEGYLSHIAGLLAYAFSDTQRSAPPLVNGRTLMQHFDVKPGPELGRLLDDLLEAQAAGDILTREDALRQASAWLEEARQPAP